VLLWAVLTVWAVILLLPERLFSQVGIERGPLYLIFRSSRGLVAIDRIAEDRRRLLKRLGTVGVVVSAPLIIFVFLSLFLNAGHILRTPDAPPGVAPLLPEGVAEIPGAPSVPWAYWLISIATIIVFHELMHGFMARAEDVPLRSLGIFSLTLLPLGAFVEPDDELLETKDAWSKLRVYAAGSLGNFIAALLGALALGLLLFIIVPLAFDQAGLLVYNVTPGSPAALAGIEANTTLLAIGGMSTATIEDFRKAVEKLQPGVPTTISTETGSFTVTPVEKKGFSHGYIGVAVMLRYRAKPFLSMLFGEERFTALIRSLSEALYWIASLNLAVGLTNLLPILPLDGGRMFAVYAEKLSPRSAKGITTFIYLLLILILLINIAPLFGRM